MLTNVKTSKVLRAIGQDLFKIIPAEYAIERFKLSTLFVIPSIVDPTCPILKRSVRVAN